MVAVLVISDEQPALAMDLAVTGSGSGSGSGCAPFAEHRLQAEKGKNAIYLVAAYARFNWEKTRFNAENQGVSSFLSPRQF